MPALKRKPMYDTDYGWDLHPVFAYNIQVPPKDPPEEDEEATLQALAYELGRAIGRLYKEGKLDDLLAELNKRERE